MPLKFKTPQAAHDFAMIEFDIDFKREMMTGSHKEPEQEAYQEILNDHFGVLWGYLQAFPGANNRIRTRDQMIELIMLLEHAAGTLKDEIMDRQYILPENLFPKLNN